MKNKPTDEGWGLLGELKALKSIIPAGWRIGQTIINFIRWLESNEKERLEGYYEWEDLFYISDEELKKLYNEFIKSIK